MKKEEGKVGRPSDPADLSMEFIIESIGKSNITFLTKDQIREALRVYFNFLEKYLKSSICPKDVKIRTPIGKFIFKEKKGMDVGSTYNTPRNFGNDKDENGKVIMEQVTITEKQPDYLRLWFEVSPTLQSELRTISEEKWKKKHGKK